MSLSKIFDRIKYIDDLIRRKATGDLEALAKKLQLSKSHTVEVLNEMKEAGFPIKYSRKDQYYYYTQSGKMISHLFDKETSDEGVDTENTLSKDQLRPISGGKTYFNFFLHSDYIRMNDWNFVK